MKLSGQLAEYSLSEIFNFIHQGSRTGLLTLSAINNLSTSSNNITNYLWFQTGRIVSITNGLSGTELFTRIVQRNLIPSDKFESIGAELYHLSEPLGLALKSHGLLDAGQIKLIFNGQTIVPAYKLFELKNREFQFEPNKLPINSEMTGMSVPAREIGLMGLRLLNDWSGLSDKLPDPNYAIARRFSQEPDFELNRHEFKLWTLADGKTPLTQLAVKMSLSIDIVRQIAFRLCIFGTLQEIPRQPTTIARFTEFSAASSNKPVSTSLLGNLKKFLTKGSVR